MTWLMMFAVTDRSILKVATRPKRDAYIRGEFATCKQGCRYHTA
jgi:hypothetical protein